MRYFSELRQSWLVCPGSIIAKIVNIGPALLCASEMLGVGGAVVVHAGRQRQVDL